MYILKSTNQYVDLKGQVYPMTSNGNIDDMSNAPTGNVLTLPQSWWDKLSAYDLKIADIIYGELK